MAKKDKLSTKPYKGVRDFYPAEMAVQNHIFSAMRQAVERFGYLEYNASPIEPAELYQQKSGQEIAETQAYRFTDKGGREVALRPEMTPTVARMIAGRSSELKLPTRWYSIPNVFRYENPQRGRLREHYQLNVDLFGGETEAADQEILLLVREIMNELRAKPTDYLILLNNRQLLDQLLDQLQIPTEKRPTLTKLLDRKNKTAESAFKEALDDLLGHELSGQLKAILESSNQVLATLGPDQLHMKQMLELIESLDHQGVTNVVFDPTLVRGFDYYTGMVFEVFDTHPDNRRSIFGGGRYDALTTLFSDRAIPAVGFGMGDVRTRDFLEVHDLLPQYSSGIKIALIPLSVEWFKPAQLLAQKLRQADLATEVDIGNKKIGEKIKRAVNLQIPFALFLGPDEVAQEQYTLRNLETETESVLTVDQIIDQVQTYQK